MSKHPKEACAHSVSPAMPTEGTGGPYIAKGAELACWWQFWHEYDALVLDVARWEAVPTPTATDLATRDAGLAAARLALAEQEKRGGLQPGPAGLDDTPKSATPEMPSPEVSPDDHIAAWFDPVPVAALAKMFPVADEKWKRWAERASDNGLKTARVERGLFNPYKAAKWFLRRGFPGWDQARIFHVLAINLPARSHDKRDLLTL
jgi:hypothetical protein